MSWIENLLNDIPSASHYRHHLEAMEKENAALKQENTLLRSELDAVRARAIAPDRLDAEAEQMLAFISREEYASVDALAQALSLSTQAIEMHIEDLLKAGYVEPSYASGQSAEYYLKHKAKRYLHGVGLL